MKRHALKPEPRTITILDAIDDPNLFGHHFKNPQTWAAWRVFLATLFGLPLTGAQRELFKECTGREHAPDGGSNEAWLVIGRRGGKSFILAMIAVYLASFKDWRRYLGPGEVGTVMVIAADRKQARVIMRYVIGLLRSVPMLAPLVVSETRERIELNNRIVIEVHTASFRSTRGYTIVAALLDELAFWPVDEAAVEQDVEIINALRPGMATVEGAMLLCASSPYSRRGALWDAHRRHFGKDGDPILVWQAPTRTMNPSVPQRVIDEAMEYDPARAAAEYGAQFRSDIEGFVSREIVQACVSPGVYERPPSATVPYYSAFLDPAGGSGSDSMTLAIGHEEGNAVVIDAVREVKPPFSPEFVVEEFAALLKSYGSYTVQGDRFGGEFCREPFSKRGINYELAEHSKSELYAHFFMPMLNSGRVDLLDNPRLLQQIIGLERRKQRGGRESIDHAPGAHDDLANCVAGLVARIGAGDEYDVTGAFIIGDDKPRPEDPKQREQRIREIIEQIKQGKMPV